MPSKNEEAKQQMLEELIGLFQSSAAIVQDAKDNKKLNTTFVQYCSAKHHVMTAVLFALRQFHSQMKGTEQ